MYEWSNRRWYWNHFLQHRVMIGKSNMDWLHFLKLHLHALAQVNRFFTIGGGVGITFYKAGVG